MCRGLWLNQCLTRDHPTAAGAATAQAARNAVRMLWQGATRPAGQTD